MGERGEVIPQWMEEVEEVEGGGECILQWMEGVEWR